MAFNALASHSTKSIITTTNYPLDEPFVIRAYHYAKDGSANGVLIDRDQVQYYFESALWKTEEDRMWPSDGRVVFFAGSPAVPEINFSEEHGVTADWSIPSDSDTQTDLCFAEASENCESHSVQVPIVFSHALSQICFKARTLKQYSYSRQENNLIQANVINVVLDSIKIGGIVSRGTFTQKPRHWELQNDQTSSYLVYKNEEGLELGSDRYDNPILEKLNTILLIPQPIPDDSYIEEWHHIIIRSSVTDSTTGQILSDQTDILPLSERIPIRRHCAEWETDVKYTFRIAVGMEPAEVATAVTDWTETKEIILGDE